jgi:hypothetical protein
MRTLAVTKASRLKAVLSWSKTIWVVVRSMSELRQSTRESARQNTRIRTRQKINKLITIWVSSIIKAHLLNSLTAEAKLIQVIGTTTKHAHKSFISQLGVLFPHFSLRVEGWLWIDWVVSFCGFNCFLLFVVVEARNELINTFLTLILTPLISNTQFICGFGCTLLNLAQVILYHFLAQNSFLKTCNQIGNLLLKLDVLFDSMEKLTLERATRITWRG